MGIENRDYYRSSSPYTSRLGWSLDSIPPSVRFILIATIVVYVLQFFVTRERTLADAREAFERNPQLKKMIEQQQARAKRIEERANRKNSKSSAAEKAADSSEENTETNPSESSSTATSEKPATDVDDEWIDEFDGYPFDGFGGRERVSVLEEWLQMDTSKVLKGQIWRLLTVVFCHDRYSIYHILFNMFLLYRFGMSLEYMYGSLEFRLFYFAAAIVSSIAYLALDCFTGQRVPAVGASGAVMCVLTLYAIHYPGEHFCIFWFISIPIRWLLFLYIAYDLHPILLTLSGENFFSSIGHSAHLGGVAFGYVYWRQGIRLVPLWGLLEGFWSRWRKKRPQVAARPKLKVYRELTAEPVRETIPFPDIRLDEILAKIHDHGVQSLSDEEQQYLKDASARLRNRQEL